VLPILNFPQYKFRIRKLTNGTHEIFDEVRKKFVFLNPEEWVRQHLIQFLIQEKQFPLSLLAVEKQLILNGTKKRTDVLVYTNTLTPLLIVECKAPEISLSTNALNQALRYNLVFNVNYLIITNGLQHFFYQKSAETGQWSLENELPSYLYLLK
jgi:hypothetical protein